MSDILIAQPDALSQLSSREQKQYERFQNQAVRIKDLPQLFGRLLEQPVGQLHQSIMETDIAVLSLIEILEEKGLIEKGEVTARIADKVRSLAADPEEEEPDTHTEVYSEGAPRRIID